MLDVTVKSCFTMVLFYSTNLLPPYANKPKYGDTAQAPLLSSRFMHPTLLLDSSHSWHSSSPNFKSQSSYWFNLLLLYSLSPSIHIAPCCIKSRKPILGHHFDIPCSTILHIQSRAIPVHSAPQMSTTSERLSEFPLYSFAIVPVTNYHERSSLDNTNS